MPAIRSAQLETIAKALAEVEVGVACEGTALESRTYKTRGKAFLFVRAVDARFKVDAARGEVTAAAAKAPGACSIGAGGWVHVRLGVDGLPAGSTIARWIAESHALAAAAGKTPRAKEAAGRAAPPKKAAAKKRSGGRSAKRT